MSAPIDTPAYKKVSSLGGYLYCMSPSNFPQAHKALDETVEFSEAIRKASEIVDLDETLIVVTADHSHTMTINGYPTRGNDILGKKVNSRE